MQVAELHLELVFVAYVSVVVAFLPEGTGSPVSPGRRFVKESFRKWRASARVGWW
jgi:hypothetical protein